MRRLTRLVSVGAITATALGLVAQPAFANGDDDDHERGAKPAVFVPTNDSAGNQVVAYARGADGNLTFAASYSTGGQGGALNGAAVDKLASQGALTYDARHHLLFTVNAGSNTVSVFKTNGTHLSLRQVISSGGSFPVSVAVHGNVVYVLNARTGGSIQGFRLDDGRLHPSGTRTVRWVSLSSPTAQSS